MDYFEKKESDKFEICFSVMDDYLKHNIETSVNTQEFCLKYSIPLPKKKKVISDDSICARILGFSKDHLKESKVYKSDIENFSMMKKINGNYFQLRRSPIHGLGVFTLSTIEENSLVMEYLGEIIRPEITYRRVEMYSELRVSRSYMFDFGADAVLDATKYGNLARYINHSCDPNCYTATIVTEDSKKIVIITKRRININEELTFDYHFDISNDFNDKIVCLCGASQCKTMMN